MSDRRAGYDGVGGLPDETSEGATVIGVVPNGPLFVRGHVEVRDPAGRVLADEHRLALCRCGASANKPFCDNSHRKIRFRDAE
ncbi:MAG: CDGSH iron-sulfur domain-containing protein [Acidimicrobiales bacterium]